MPLVRIVSSSEVPPQADALLQELSRTLARELGKPESYVMTCLEPRARMTFAGTPAPSCYVEVKNIGTFTSAVTGRLSALICERLSSTLGVPPDRIYIEFADAKGHLWGHDGSVFG
jgi:phenylpyruvate tautomerase